MIDVLEGTLHVRGSFVVEAHVQVPRVGWKVCRGDGHPEAPPLWHSNARVAQVQVIAKNSVRLNRGRLAVLSGFRVRITFLYRQ
jgi:hypothetical protein